MPATMRPLTSAHPKIEQFLRSWHENGRAQFQRSMPSHNHDTEQRKIAKNRRQYLLLCSGKDGVFLVQRSTQYVYQVDDYGRRGKFLNTLDALIEQYTMTNEGEKEAEATIRTGGSRPLRLLLGGSVAGFRFNALRQAASGREERESPSPASPSVCFSSRANRKSLPARA